MISSFSRSQPRSCHTQLRQHYRLQAISNPGALIPVVVQPRLISSAVYNAPQTGNGRVLTNPVAAGLLRGRSGV